MLNYSEDRKIREKVFHDDRYTDDPRQSISIFYKLSESTKKLYHSFIEKDVKGKKILEYGCGNGEYCLKLSQAGGIVHGIDISPIAINNALEKARYLDLKANFQVMDAESMDYANNNFDLIYGSGILHHLNLKRSLKEINRVLKNGGEAIFFEPLGHNVCINMFRFFTPKLRTKDEHPLLNSDIEYIQKVYPNTYFGYHHMTTFFSLPLINTRYFQSILKVFDRFDNMLIDRIPSVGKYCWITIIKIKKSK